MKRQRSRKSSSMITLAATACAAVFLIAPRGGTEESETPSTQAADAEQPKLPKAFIDGIGPDWHPLGEADFVNVNCDPDTWTWKDGVAHCTGQPVGVIRSREPITNLELVVEWRHLKSGGNSGVFLWA